jgi:hydroxymethylpyrimidine pyrophosphatase-like HAD family hydrolase
VTVRYRLLVADIDGTLVNAAREITPPVHAAVAEAQARGSSPTCTWTTASTYRR